MDKVPEKGCLIAIGYPKFAGCLGGYARYIAICPADWKYGVAVGEVAEAPLPKSDKILQWDNQRGMRIRKWVRATRHNTQNGVTVFQLIGYSLPLF